MGQSDVDKLMGVLTKLQILEEPTYEEMSTMISAERRKLMDEAMKRRREAPLASQSALREQITEDLKELTLVWEKWREQREENIYSAWKFNRWRLDDYRHRGYKFTVEESFGSDVI